MKICPWFKVYSYLNNKYFIRNKMVIKLIYTNENVAVYQVIRNEKIVTTRLDDFVKSFSILNYSD